MDIYGFFQKYFVEPIFKLSGYNVYNTTVYAIAFVIIAYSIYKLLIKLKIKIDRSFAIGIFPYIMFGGILRALQDAYQISYWFITPLIYFVILGIALPSLLVSRLVWKDEYYKSWSLFGFALCILCLFFMKFVRIEAAVLVAGITFFWFATFYAISKAGKMRNFMNKENIGLLTVHSFDATTTFVSLQFFPYIEQHVLGGLFVNIFGPVGMYILKIPVVVLVLYILDKELKKEKNLKNFIKIAILLLGLGPGLRNILRLLMAV